LWSSLDVTPACGAGVYAFKSHQARMTANFVPYKDSLEVQKVDEEKVVFKLEGFATSTSDMDTTDKNAVIEFELSRSKAQDIFEQL
jgi:hypothetical protein